MPSEMDMLLLGAETDDNAVSPSVVSEQIWLVLSIVLLLGLVVALAQLSRAEDLKDVIKNWDQDQVRFMQSAPKESLLRAIADVLREKEDAESITRFADLTETRSTTDPQHPCRRVIVVAGLPNDAEARRMFLFAKQHLADAPAGAALAERLFQSALHRVPAAERTLIEHDPTLGTGDPNQSVVEHVREIIRSRLDAWRKHVALTEISLVEQALSDPTVVSRVADSNTNRVRARIVEAFQTQGYPLLPGVLE